MSNLLKGIFYHINDSVIAVFTGFSLVGHAAAIILTYFIVTSGLDGWYFAHLGHGLTLNLGLPAALIGFFVPIFVPLFLLYRGRVNARALNAAYAVAQAEIVAWVVIAMYKFFTGRAHPEIFSALGADMSQVFNFGFGRGGVFWGWPSTHTACAFAMSACLLILYPESKKIKYFGLLYAFYIGWGVSISIHWFSDFVAGAIIGTLVGICVARVFRERLQHS